MSRLVAVVVLLVVVGVAMTLTFQWLGRPTPDVVDPVVPRASRDDSAIPQGHIYTGIAAEPRNLNPFTTTEATVRSYVLGFTHEGLFDYDPQTGDLRGALAESWEESEDGASMTVTVRRDVRFADGSPMTIDDVLFTYRVLSNAAVVPGSVVDGMALVDSVEPVDGEPWKLRIGFDRHHFAAAAVVGTSWVVVSKDWFLERVAELAGSDGQEVPQLEDEAFGALLSRIEQSPGPGTGPYRFSDDPRAPSWRRGSDLTLRRNEYAWSRAARPGSWNLGGVRLLFLTDQAASYTALVGRELDWYSSPGSGKLLTERPELAEDYKQLVYDGPTTGVFMAQWNCRREHLSDPRVRRALSMLFDREVIADRILAGHALPAVAFARPGSPGYPEDLTPPGGGGPEQVRRLVREAGFDPSQGSPLRVELLTPAGAPWYRRMAELARGAAVDAGVDLQVREMAFELLVQRREGEDWDGVLLMNSLDRHGDPHELLHSQGAGNVMGWHHPDADRWIEELRVSGDPGVRASLLGRLHHLVHEEQPVALLVHPLVAILFNRHIHGAEPGPLGLWPERFWVAPDHQRSAR